VAAEHIATRGLLTVSLLNRLLAEPLVRESFIAEGTIKGLFLLRRPAAPGARHPNRASWLLRWSDGSKAKKKMSLGDARTILLDAARRSAQAHLATVVQGRDPAQERRERRRRLTVDDIWKPTPPTQLSPPKRRGLSTRTATAISFTSPSTLVESSSAN